MSVLLVAVILLTACSIPTTNIQKQAEEALQSVADTFDQGDTGNATVEAKPMAQATSLPSLSSSEVTSLLAAYEESLTKVYEDVNPSVVNIRVLADIPTVVMEIPSIPGNPFNFPGMPESPEDPDQQIPENPQLQEGLGSGFVWDKQGHIVTNNHVVDQAKKIEITFSDGTIVPAEVVGKDPYSDLAVLKVELPSEQLKPVELFDSHQVKVGELAIAIGNPFGYEGTMTVGIVSAIGRNLPATEGNLSGPTYSIPDIIQTDAPINPGNSGGVLVNEQGQVLGVTFAIESAVQSNSGIGFVIPSSIVNRVVPTLIAKGHYEHPYLGISGISMTPDLATAMDLDESQRGVLIGEVMPNSPAEKSNLQGSEEKATIDGQDVSVGGDVIVAIDDNEIKGMDELIAYLANNTEIDQKVSLTILRDGEKMDVDLKLEARPQPEEVSSAPVLPQAKAYLGITGLNLTPEIAQEMDLDENQGGVLVEEVQDGSPADEAGLKGGSKTTNIQGVPIRIGGDVIIALDGEQVNSVEDLRVLLADMEPEQKVNLTILRNGEEMQLEVVLGEPPA